MLQAAATPRCMLSLASEDNPPEAGVADTTIAVAAALTFGLQHHRRPGSDLFAHSCGRENRHVTENSVSHFGQPMALLGMRQLGWLLWLSLVGCGETHQVLGTVDGAVSSDAAVSDSGDSQVRVNATFSGDMNLLRQVVSLDVIVDSDREHISRHLESEDLVNEPTRTFDFQLPYGGHDLRFEVRGSGRTVLHTQTLNFDVNQPSHIISVTLLLEAECSGQLVQCRRARLADSMNCCSADTVSAVCTPSGWVCPEGSVQPAECAPDDAAACVRGECDAMDARTSFDPFAFCEGGRRTEFRWDGIRCAPIAVGCAATPCEGVDCERLFESEQACIGAYLACGAGTCESMNVAFSNNGDGTCSSRDWRDEWYWNGYACQQFPDCSARGLDCTGGDCENGFESKEQCQAAYATCVNRCDAADVDFPPLVRGEPSEQSYSWTGGDCTPHLHPEGATCSGSDCATETFDDLKQCRDHYGACIGTPRLGGRSRALDGDLVCGIEVRDLARIAALTEAGTSHDWHELLMSYFALDTALLFQSISPRISCEELQCLRDAENRSEAVLCSGGRPDQCTEDRCAGANQSCGLSSSTYSSRLCSLVGGECAQGVFPTCLVPGSQISGNTQSRCDGDDLITATGSRTVRLSCPEHIPGSTCREVMLHGEIPMGTCGFADATCDEFGESSVATCEGSNAIYCIGGHRERVDCTALGFTGCASGVGCNFE